MRVDRAEIEEYYRSLQGGFCTAIEEVDGRSRFLSDVWDRPGGGGGDTRILAGDGHIEKAAVNVSAVWGTAPPTMPGTEFYAAGVSIIVHPRNPYAPTFHANMRYMATDETAWFGGGADLTPYYFFEEDARHFHRVISDVCSRHEVADYEGWKEACDRYFYLSHRGEARGVGGIFFDELSDHLDEVWAFQRELGDHLLDAYLPILGRRVWSPYGEREDRWHEYRRGRYVEFNLVWDRGTRFGLETNGRTESILASLPPRARWQYGYEPDPGTPEASLTDVLRGVPPRWV